VNITDSVSAVVTSTRRKLIIDVTHLVCVSLSCYNGAVY